MRVKKVKFPILLFLLPFCLMTHACKQNSGNTSSAGEHDTDQYAHLRCSDEIVEIVGKHIKSLDRGYITDLLATFHPSCNYSAELSRKANTQLYFVLQFHTKEMVEIMANNEKLYKNAILSSIENPKSAKIDFKKITLNLEEMEAYEDLRKRLAASLIRAQSKMLNNN